MTPLSKSQCKAAGLSTVAWGAVALFALTASATAAKAEPAAPQTISPIAVGHHGYYDGEGLRWEVTFAITDTDIQPRGVHRIHFAAALPAETTVQTKPPGLAAPVLNERGELYALDLDRNAFGLARSVGSDWFVRARVTLDVGVRPDESETLPLVVPLVAGNATQRVDLEALESVGMDIDPQLGIERGVRHHMGEDVDHKLRRRCRKLLGLSRRVGGAPPVYTTATQRIVDNGSVLGRVVPQAQKKGRAAIGAGFIFLLVVVGLGIAYKRLEHRAEYERSLDVLRKIEEEL